MMVSVITVCFNSVRTIEKTIKSVLSQDYSDIEYIIIDGGSTDGTVDIIKKYDKDIAFWISEPDDGIYDAMNKGIKIATGEIIGIVNSDDWYGEGTLRAAVRSMEEHPECGVVHGNEMDVDLDGSMCPRNLKTVITKDYLAEFTHPTFFVRKDVYRKYGMFDCRYKTDADGDFVYRLFFAGVKFFYCKEILTYYRLGGRSSQPDARRERFIVHRKYAGMLPDGKKEKARTAIRMLHKNARLVGICEYLDDKTLWGAACLHKGEKIIIFGFCDMGMKLCEWLVKEDRKDDIVCFVDNSPEKRGKVYSGINVESPEIIRKNSAVCIVIAAPGYHGEIERQILDTKLTRRDRIFSYLSLKEYLTGTMRLKKFTWIVPTDW